MKTQADPLGHLGNGAEHVADLGLAHQHQGQEVLIRSLMVEQQAQVLKETCPQCAKQVAVDELLERECPWCGWQSSRAKNALAAKPALPAVEA